MSTRLIRLVSVSVILACALVAAPEALAAPVPLAAPLVHAGHTVGTARGSLSLTSNGFAVLNVRVIGFRAPSADRSWRTRTTLTTSCVEPGFDPAEDDPADFASTTIRYSSAWKTTRVTGRTGTLWTNDFVKECPAGQVPGSSLQLTLLVQNSAGTTRVGFANLFSAG